MKSVYIVMGYRWGDFDGHSYIVGVYATEGQAMAKALHEEEYRGGKYTCRVVEHEVDGPELRVVKELE